MHETIANAALDDWASYDYLQGHTLNVSSALSHLFEAASPISTSDEPPRKKRKTADDSQDQYIEVAQHTITLVTDEASGSVELGGTPSILPVRLHLGQEYQRRWPYTDRSRSANGTYPLNISLKHNVSKTISLLLSRDQYYYPLTEILQTICSLDHHATHPGPSQRPRAVAVADCYLKPPTSTTPHFHLNVRVKWRVGLPGYQFIKSDWLHEAARRYLPGSTSSSGKPWSPQDFYKNVHLPNKNEPIPDTLQARGLNTQLYVFQKRAVRWLLQRERMRIGETGTLERIPEEDLRNITSFESHRDADGQLYHTSRLLEEVRTGEKLPYDEDLSGGILASEMGLGKTVEIIALVLLHPRVGELAHKAIDPYTGTEVHPSRGTLIITPPNILSQWQSELERHSPGLKVHHYEGIQKSKASEHEIRGMLQEQDIVLTTYAILAREIHHAREPPKRNMRHAKAYEARRSPLVSIDWWRVCLDEAQMVESGVSNAATVARLIPRQHSWAISGTPLRKDITDLQGLFIFLRLDPYCYSDIFNRLLFDWRDLMTKLIGSIALRNTKHDLRDELALPPQKRVTITCSFTAIEAQRYSDLFRQMCEEVGLDTVGAPVTNAWNPEHPSTIEKMRSWLSRLRSTCLHAEIGGRNRRALGTKGGPLRTVDEVLEVMIDQNETAMRTQQRAVLDQRIIRGQLYSFGKDPTTALSTFEEAFHEAAIAVNEAREQLELERVKQSHDVEMPENESKEQEDALGDEDEMSDERKDRLGLLRNRLRLALELQHVCLFFKATAIFQIKDNADLTEPDSKAWQDLDRQESECYDQAKGIRRELLSNVSKKTTQLMGQVREIQHSSAVAFSVIRPIEHFRGLESRKIMEKTEMLRRMMNEYAGHLIKWRSRLVELMLQNLLDQEDETLTGEEYEASTKAQDEQYCLLEALRAGLADRHCVMTGQINTLLNHEMKQALKLATDGKRDEPEDKGPAPELFREILSTRQSLVPPENLQVANAQKMLKPSVSFRGIMTEIRSLVTAVQWQASERSKAEAAILEQELQNLQGLFNNQMKEISRFEKDLDIFRSTMNQRLEFYKQLQQISDQVAPLQEEATDEVDQERLVLVQERENAANDRLTTLKTKQRFLLHLRDQSSGKAESQLCVICQDYFEVGQLTSCGHTYCRDCLTIWWNQHRSCPMCKAPLRSQKDFFQVTYKPNELKAKEEAYSSPTSSGDQSSGTGSPTKPSIYASVSDSILKDIKNIDLPSTVSYGVKVDTICRHLLYLRDHDPGSKSIIFSQYRDFLNVLGRAFASQKIGYADIMAKSGIRDFREDPGKECFLLHAKADSSGLNLVNATHVFLCEPLINPGIELQAVARVHRIGQRRPTTVWMYIVRDTVEEAIHEISVQRRLAHLKRGAASLSEPSRATTPSWGLVNEAKLDTANSIELQSAPISKLLTSGQSGGEVVPKDDLWSCLFSRPNKGAEQSLTSMSGPADGELGTFLRAEAAEARRTDV